MDRSDEPSRAGLVERVARAIAEGLGDDFDHAFPHKTAWTAARGESGGRVRDINEPFQADYIEAARVAIEAMREPTEAMIEAGLDADAAKPPTPSPAPP